jgi:hypothetical protein
MVIGKLVINVSKELAEDMMSLFRWQQHASPKVSNYMQVKRSIIPQKT